MYGFLFVGFCLVIASYVDYKERRIPNLISLVLLLTGFGFNASMSGMEGFWFSLQGFVSGFGLFFIFYYLNTMGAGDVKLFAAVGSWVGWIGAIQMFLWTAVIGLLIAVVYLMKERKLRIYLRSVWFSIVNFLCFRKFDIGVKPDKKTHIRIPYAIPITLGYLAYIQFGGLL